MIHRGSGILLHITSLPSSYGIGTLGKAAYDFVDFLYQGGQRYWQVLPLCPVGHGNSPYQSFSTFAGDPFFIDFDLLSQEGLLARGDYESVDFGKDPERVDYSKIYRHKYRILKQAFRNGKEAYKEKTNIFREKHRDWIEDYGLFMALKTAYSSRPWMDWEEGIRQRKESDLEHHRRILGEEIEYWIFLQALFDAQWQGLKSYANHRGIQIIGDLPIYTALDSADTWANSGIFLLDEKDRRPIKVAGCPPDYFSKEGQLWGNPIYRWDVLEERNFDWWIQRVKRNRDLYDIIRLDHFRGIESYWEVPYGDATAVGGRWVKGPGIQLFHEIEKALGRVNIIAEDLGMITPEVHQLRRDTGYPGMAVLQFAFDPLGDSVYLPHHHQKNAVVYTGTHDNDTIMGWWESISHEERAFAADYLKLNGEEGIHWGLIRGAWSSVCDVAIAPLQDFLGLGSEARMNTPSTVGGNWEWRVKAEACDFSLGDQIKKLTNLYRRSMEGQN